MKLTKLKLKQIIKETIEEVQKEFYVNYLDMTGFSADNLTGEKKSDGPFKTHVAADAHLRRVEKDKDIRDAEIGVEPGEPKSNRPDSLRQRADPRGRGRR